MQSGRTDPQKRAALRSSLVAPRAAIAPRSGRERDAKDAALFDNKGFKPLAQASPLLNSPGRRTELSKPDGPRAPPTA